MQHRVQVVAVVADAGVDEVRYRADERTVAYDAFAHQLPHDVPEHGLRGVALAPLHRVEASRGLFEIGVELSANRERDCPAAPVEAHRLCRLSGCLFFAHGV